jgi:tetratricopeptide (TPR) repeat protein
MFKRVIALLFLSIRLAFAENIILDEYNLLFKKGEYENAIQALEKIPKDSISSGERYYYLGITYNKLQTYDKSVKNFKLSLSEKYSTSDLYYEFGQALYATNDLKNAREMFSKSYELKFNSTASLYYMGYISQIFEEYANALKYFSEILKLKENDLRFEQIAKFQIAETQLIMSRESGKGKKELTLLVSKKIIPMLKLSLDVDKSTLVSFDIEKRIKELELEFDLDPNVLLNERRISPKRFFYYISLRNKFDNNVTNTGLENDTQQSKKESFLAELETEIKNLWVLKRRFLTMPLFRFNYTKYSNQDESEVYQNDSLIYNLSLKNKYETKFKDRPASLIIDLDYFKTYKDYQGIHKKESYSNSKVLTIGSQINLTPRGDTNIKLKLKTFSAYLESLDNHTTSISLDQTYAINNGNLSIYSFNIDKVNNINNVSTNTDSYLFRIDYIIPEIFYRYTLNTALSLSVLDTLALRESRGHETTINPNIELSRDFTNGLKGSISIDYSKNNSKSSDYRYNYVTIFKRSGCFLEFFNILEF